MTYKHYDGHHKQVNRQRLDQYHRLETDMEKVTMGGDDKFKQRLSRMVRKIGGGIALMAIAYAGVHSAITTDFKLSTSSYRQEIESIKKSMPIDHIPILHKVNNPNILYDAEKGYWPLTPSQLNSFTPEELRKEGHAIYEQVMAVREEIDRFYDFAAKNGLSLTDQVELELAAKLFDRSKGVEMLDKDQSMELLRDIGSRSDFISEETFGPATIEQARLSM